MINLKRRKIFNLQNLKNKKQKKRDVTHSVPTLTSQGKPVLKCPWIMSSKCCHLGEANRKDFAIHFSGIVQSPKLS